MDKSLSSAFYCKALHNDAPEFLLHLPMRSLAHCTALLFDGSSAEATSRLFETPHHAWVVMPNDGRAALRQALDEMDQLSRSGTYVVLSMSYEASQYFAASDGLVLNHKPHAHPDLKNTPLLQALAFDRVTELSRDDAFEWLFNQAQHSPIQMQPTRTCVDETTFVAHINEIRERIAAGETYQVNYTFPMLSEILGEYNADHPDALLAQAYLQLIQDLRIPYGAYLTLPHNSILSCSPELFCELRETTLTCKPMKGTMPVAEHDNETTRRAALLASDPKNRSENLMIVDLMRNDLARLSCVTHVRVPTLFDVKRYGTVLQMTSTIRADLIEQPSLLELCDALFPCGSITGAPKRQTLSIIDRLEPYQRGVYCGTIGWLESIGSGKINATFSVPIRTLESSAHPLMGIHASTSSDTTSLVRWPVQLSVGAGITYESDAHDEWQESLLKSRFYNQHTQVFELIETMRVVNKNGVWQVPLIDRHEQRISHSAHALGIAFNESDFHQCVTDCLSSIPAHMNQQAFLRLRVGLRADGTLHPTLAIPEPAPIIALFDIHPTSTQSSDVFLQHKTTVRSLYNQAIAQAKTAELFDYVFINELGQITEGARTNLFVQINGQWLTPPLSSGVLAGVQRSVLMEELKAQEHVLSATDVAQAQAWMLTNAVYGALPAQYKSHP